MSEQLLQTPKMPSGYESSLGIQERVSVDRATLPWLDHPAELAVSEFTLQSGETFLAASAVGTHPKLVSAAEGMTEKQKKITDNMFYSRIPEIILSGYSPSVETMPSPATDFPIFVMRNNGGQRVYFSRKNLGLPQEEQCGPTIIRLAVCDKNRQGLVMSVLSGAGDKQAHRKLSK